MLRFSHKRRETPWVENQHGATWTTNRLSNPQHCLDFGEKQQHPGWPTRAVSENAISCWPWSCGCKIPGIGGKPWRGVSKRSLEFRPKLGHPEPADALNQHFKESYHGKSHKSLSEQIIKRYSTNNLHANNLHNSTHIYYIHIYTYIYTRYIRLSQLSWFFITTTHMVNQDPVQKCQAHAGLFHIATDVTWWHKPWACSPWWFCADLLRIGWWYHFRSILKNQKNEMIDIPIWQWYFSECQVTTNHG